MREIECPCCGSGEYGDWVKNPLSPLESSVFRAVRFGNGSSVTTKKIIDYVYREKENGGPLYAEDAIYGMVHRIRLKLGPVIERAQGGYRLCGKP